jgi:N-ethylmaleimide reductase
MHVGRVASHFNQPAGSKTVAPSGLKAKGQVYTDKAGMQDYDTPQELAVGEIESVIEEYRQATKNAVLAGFDGVELHCTSGYLPAQFLSTGTNHRVDSYGGSVQNRIRFVVEVLEAMISVSGAPRVAIRICPDNPFNDLHDAKPEETFRALLKALSPHSLAYVHVIRFPQGRVNNIALAKEYFLNSLVLNESYSAEEAELSVESGESKAVSFGRPFIANPDLPKRIELAASLEGFTMASLYAGGASGYTDYPLLDDD